MRGSGKLIERDGLLRARVVRGGSWNNNRNNARCAYRNRNEPDNFNNNLGFRVALSHVFRLRRQCWPLEKPAAAEAKNSPARSGLERRLAATQANIENAWLLEGIPEPGRLLFGRLDEFRMKFYLFTLSLTVQLM